jgi:hypothetical protein
LNAPQLLHLSAQGKFFLSPKAPELNFKFAHRPNALEEWEDRETGQGRVMEKLEATKRQD